MTKTRTSDKLKLLMLMLKALRHRPIARLWFGQALSSIGDEIYRVGLTWMAVGLIGADTGYLNAAQAGALMLLSFIGGKWADHWQPVRTMVNVDLVRTAIVLVPVIYSLFAPVNLTLLVVVALLLSGLGAFFDPALQTVLPIVAPDIPTLRATTGLMGTTIRMARMVGPAMIGFLAGVIPVVHFFTLDALSFLASAASVRGLPQGPPLKNRPRQSFAQAIMSGFKQVREVEGMTFITFAKAITGCTWNLAIGLGLALLVNEIAPGDMKLFGWTVAAYGIGNLAGNLLFGNRHRPKPASMMFIGFLWMGAGLILISLCTSAVPLFIAAAFASFSGCMSEITYFDLVQIHFPVQDMGRVLRLRLACDQACTMVLLLIAPMLFRYLGVHVVLQMCGVVWLLVGLSGFIWFVRALGPDLHDTRV
jgi:MFS family permease